MHGSAMAIWQTVHSVRLQLAADLSDLDHDQWRTPSLCPGWDVHDVLAHLVDTARTGRLSFVRELIAARLDFDRANERGIAREKRSDPLETVAALRDSANLTRTPPANLATRLVEVIVHGEDIRRPLGLVGNYPAGAIAEALEYQLRTPVSFGGGRERTAGVRLIDRKTGTSWGAGDDGEGEVEGDAIDLLLAVSGRQVDPQRLTGSGASRLAAAAGPPADRAPRRRRVKR
ncbi:maleylpyruvate isomerase family mycothiol-dependent enzyme [Brevibacterium daeguense]|uniref:Maleylpyruvate isomerase family mycothiol-dependent enzyme n=1 Tax=Brevibacterium daeguense TaxID=909936 RepID=A0ABP8EIE2_9MICO|nr:maleylpyruvate isomerase family mycothiol-dependent enzyme [Brevibacterium daeguense]